MTIWLPIIMIIAGYLFGSIPIGYLMGRLRGVDLLKSGSGRTGSTNVLRAAGLPAATITILGDAFKGIIPTLIAANLAIAGLFPHWVTALVGLAAVLGHNYSIFLKFRGGAGGITALGVLAALSVWTALAACVAAILAIVVTRYASAGTFIGAVTGLVMLTILTFIGTSPAGYILFGILAVLLIGWGLRPNFAAIRAGTERKIGTPEERIETIE